MAKTPKPPEDMDAADARGWRGFHEGEGLTEAGAPRAIEAGEATRYLRGWWLAYAHHFGRGAVAAAVSPMSEEVPNPWPQFSAAWEAWAAGFESVSDLYVSAYRAPYVVDLYADGAEIAADCLPEFFKTRREAEEAGASECVRVAGIEPEDRVSTFDWAVRYTVRDIRDEEA